MINMINDIHTFDEVIKKIDDLVNTDSDIIIINCQVTCEQAFKVNSICLSFGWQLIEKRDQKGIGKVGILPNISFWIYDYDLPGQVRIFNDGRVWVSPTYRNDMKAGIVLIRKDKKNDR